MSGPLPDTESRRSRWLPTAVVSLFAVIVFADLVVVLIYGNYRNLFEDDQIKVFFVPAGDTAEGAPAEAVDSTPGAGLVAADGAVMVRASDADLEVLVPGRLTVRFRVPDAGAYVALRYRFGERRPGARCELTLARVASSYGVDTVCRRSLDGGKRERGSFRHYLADHTGWFELAFDVNAEAAELGFSVTRPEIKEE